MATHKSAAPTPQQHWCETALKKAGIAIFEQDANLRYTRISSQDDVFSETRMQGKTDAELLPPEEAEVLTAMKQEALQSGGHISRDVPITIEGVRRFYRMTVTPFTTEEDAGLLLYSTAVDITSQKHSEQRAIESERRYRALVTAGSQIVYRMSPDWREMRQLTGRGFLADTDAPDADWTAKYIPREDQDHVWWHINRAIRSRSMFDLEHRILLEDGSIGWIHSRAVPLFDDQGAIEEWFGAASDITDRVLLQEEIVSSQQREKNAILASMQDCLYIFDEPGRLVFANEYFLDLAEAAGDEPAGKSVEALGLPPEITATLASDIDTVKRCRETVRTLIRYTTDGGQIRYLDNNLVPILDGETIVQIAGSSHDVTEQVKAREALHESEERLQLLIDAASQAVWEINASGEAVDGSPSWCAYTGQTIDEQLGYGWLEAIHPDERNRAEKMWRRAVAEKSRVNAEFRLQNPTGGWRWTQMIVVPLRNAEGEVRRWVGMNTDITPRKRAEMNLAEEARRLRLAVDAGQFGVFEWSQGDDKPIWANPRMYEIFGLTPEDEPVTEKELVANYLHPDDIVPFRSAMAKSIHSGAIFDIECRIRRRNERSWRWIKYFSRFDVTKEKEAVHMFGLLADITEEKNVEQTLLRQTKELAAANREMEAFSYSVSHDLRTPLRAIKGFSQLFMEEYGNNLDDTGRMYLQRIDVGVEKMGTLIEDMLKLSRVSRQGMDVVDVDLSSIALTIVSELKSQDPERRATVHIQPGMKAQGDRRLLKIALGNLLANAWKYTAKSVQPTIDFGMVKADGERVFFLRDTGAGFPPQQADEIFQPFRRSHTESEFPGSGIGLAIVERVIDRHGGRIWAEGQVDEGATFYFTIADMYCPLDDNPPARQLADTVSTRISP